MFPMNLKALFGKGPLTDKKIEKISKLACNPFAQPDVRMREMERLLADGSPNALRGVLKRFAANASGSIADEDEKKYLETAVAECGASIVTYLQEYILRENQLTYALRALRRIMDKEEAIAFFIEALNHRGPEDYRGHEAKLQLVWQLGDALDNAEVLRALMPFVGDHSDEVRWAVMDLCAKAAEANLLPEQMQQAVCDAFAALLGDTDTSLRIIGKAAELVSQNGWQLPKGSVLPTNLEGAYFLDKKRYLRQRARKANG